MLCTVDEEDISYVHFYVMGGVGITILGGLVVGVRNIKKAEAEKAARKKIVKDVTARRNRERSKGRGDTVQKSKKVGNQKTSSKNKPARKRR